MDPYVAEFPTRSGTFHSAALADALATPIDLAVIVTPHEGINYQAIVDHARIVYDTRACLDLAAPNLYTL